MVHNYLLDSRTKTRGEMIDLFKIHSIFYDTLVNIEKNVILPSYSVYFSLMIILKEPVGPILAEADMALIGGSVLLPQ